MNSTSVTLCRIDLHFECKADNLPIIILHILERIIIPRHGLLSSSIDVKEIFATLGIPLSAIGANRQAVQVHRIKITCVVGIEQSITVEFLGRTIAIVTYILTSPVEVEISVWTTYRSRSIGT